MRADLVPSLITVALVAVAVVLAVGLWNMLRHGSANLSQRLMRWRVVLQFVAVVLMMTALYFGMRAP